jgi:tetratricopeptide (TPR) repeat protein
MGIFSGFKSTLAGKPTVEQFERKTIGLPPEQAAPKWVEFAKEHDPLKPDNSMYGYRRAAALYRQVGATSDFIEQSLNYARAAEKVPNNSVAGDGFRVVAEHTESGTEEHYAKAGDNYRKAGEAAEADRRTTRACDMYAAAADSYERAKQFEEAIKDYAKSTAISERKKHLIRVARDQGRIAENYLRLKDFQKAAEFFVKHAEAETSRAHVDYSDGYSRAGDAYVRAGAVGEAAEAFLKDAEFSSEPAFGFRNAAQCYQKLGDGEKAVELYLKEVEDDLSKDRAFVALEVLGLAKSVGKDKAKIEAEAKKVKVPAGFSKATSAFRATLRKELDEKGLSDEAKALGA